MDHSDAIAAGTAPPPPPAHAPITATPPAQAEFALLYELARRVPGMERGFSINTHCGQMHFGPGLAANAVAACLRYVLVEAAAQERRNGAPDGGRT